MARATKPNVPKAPKSVVPEVNPDLPFCQSIGIDIPSKLLHIHCTTGEVIYNLTADALAALRQNFRG
jgi:hypothetical protein